MTRRRVAVLLAALALAADARAVACSASTAGLAFGGYDLLSTVPLTSNVTVRVTCSLQPSDGAAQRVVASTIALSPGTSGTLAQRQMANGPHRMNYNVFTTNGYATVWGDGSGGTGTQGAAFTLNPSRPTRFADLVGYGRVPALQDVAAGAYGDALVITVSF